MIEACCHHQDPCSESDGRSRFAMRSDMGAWWARLPARHPIDEDPDPNWTPWPEWMMVPEPVSLPGPAVEGHPERVRHQRRRW